MLRDDDTGLFATTLRDELKAARLPLEALEQQQMRRLRSLLARATQFVPLYREKYAGQRDWLPRISSADDLWRLPALTKNELLNAGPERCVDERERLPELYRRSTSGSLGPALALYAAGTEAVIHTALLWSGWMERVTRDDRLFCMTAPQLEFQHQFVPNVYIPVQTKAADVVAQFRAFQPTAVLGSVESIALLARDLVQINVAERRNVRFVFPFGQTLTPHLRVMIREGFDGEIFELYGSNESIWMGIECEQHDGLHVPLSQAIVQIAKLNQPDQPASPGELGEVIVTSLARSTMPIIRYRIGDVASLDAAPCRCGRQTPRLKSLEGRIYDFLMSQTGQLISPGVVCTDLAYGQDAIVDFRIVQQSPSGVCVSIVAAAGFGDADRRRIAEVMRRHLGNVIVEIEIVSEILREPSGKRRRVHRAFSLE
jgi:phenylacetate-coenzyme A ligase PaaK-like adenylate-forming protein